MRFTSTLVIALALLTGCGHPSNEVKSAASTSRVTMTLIDRVTGRVLSVNAALKFAVVEFPTGRFPEPNQRLSVYRDGQKVAELIISPQAKPLNSAFAADIVKGDVSKGDSVRDE